MAKTAETGTGTRPIRFGIMCRSHEFAAWEASCIRHLLAAEGVEAALLIVDDRPVVRPGRGQRIRDLFDPRTLFWRLYQRAVLNRRSQSTRPVDLSVELAGVPVMRCRPQQFGKWVQRFGPDDIAEIRRHDLDFVMRFAFNILRGDVLEAARYGIWSFHHDDPDHYRGQPPGFWEIYRRDPVAGTVLQRLTDRLDAGVMLHRGWFRTDPASYPATRDALFFGAAEWPARLCRQIRHGVADTLAAAPHSSGAPIYRAPNSWQMLRFGWIWLTALAAKQYTSLFRVQQWSVAVIDAPVERVAGLSSPAAPDRDTTDRLVRSARWVPEPAGRFLADPFVFGAPDGTGLTVMAEDFDWAAQRGRISAIPVTGDGAFGTPEVVIDEPWHLSYPYLLQDGGDLYCIPEMNEAAGVALYRASADRREWTRVATLIEGIPIVDPTIFRHEGRWWMFGSHADHGANQTLFAWYADALTGPWTPHVANPLKTDIRSARPAGPLFVHDGDLYRPAQDCSTGYGAAVVVNRVVRLTPDRFEEEEVTRIAPDPAGPYPTGLHTLSGTGSGTGGHTVIDGSRWGFQASALAFVIKRKARKLLGRSG